MDFSEAYRSSGPAPTFSPDGRFLATVVEYRLIIREVESLRVVQLYSCLDAIDSVEWSCNSAYVLCGIFSRGVIQVWSVENSEWTCKIDEGPAGVQAVRWSPDGTCVLAVAEFQIRITVWSLVDKKCTYLRGPKHAKQGIAFSHDGAHLAVLERSDMKDSVTVYDTRTWSPAVHFPADTADAADLAWSPQGGLLAVWESCLAYKVSIVNASSGAAIASYSAYGPDALGIKSCAWSPGGELLAVGSFDRAARLLNAVTWTPLLEAGHPGRVGEPAGVVVYREELEEPPGGGRALAAPGAPAPPPDPAARSKYGIAPLPAPVPGHRPQLDAPNPKLGVGRVAWSGDGRWLATREDSCPAAVWVWDVGAMELAAVLLHLAPVTDLAWGPRGSMLAVATGATKVHLWTPAGASIVHIPLAGFQAYGCSWDATATTLLLRGAEAFCCAYLTA